MSFCVWIRRGIYIERIGTLQHQLQDLSQDIPVGSFSEHSWCVTAFSNEWLILVVFIVVYGPSWRFMSLERPQWDLWGVESPWRWAGKIPGWSWMINFSAFGSPAHPQTSKMWGSKSTLSDPWHTQVPPFSWQSHLALTEQTLNTWMV